MQYLLFLVFAIASCRVAKPTVCTTEIVINYQGITDKPIFPLVFTTQELYSGGLPVAGIFDGRYVVRVNRDEFEVLSKTVINFNNVASGTKAPPDIQSFGVLIGDSCKQKAYGIYGRNNSISFLRNLIEITEKFRPEVRDTAKEFITITRNRLGN